MRTRIKLGKVVDAPICPKGLVLACGEFGGNTDALSAWAAPMRTQIMVVPESANQMNWAKKYADRLDFMVIDADYIGDIGATIDLCQKVRRAYPKLPLVLLSSAVKADDFTSERMLACDVTLKTPLTPSALTIGIQAAYKNNVHYRRFLDASLE